MNFHPFSRSALLAGVCLTGLIAAPLFANDADAQQQDQDQAVAGGGDAGAQTSGQADGQSGDIDENVTGLGAGSGEIVVRAQRIRGSLDVQQAPILELGEAEIAAEGVTSIADLITQITSQTGSARGRGDGGRPVILINGIRVGSFREFANYPPESLARVEVFPEEVAQRFGFPPDRRVINLILKENYRNAEVEFEFEGPSRGGYFVNEQEIGFLQIADGARINGNFTARDSSLLTEDERNIIQTPGSISDVAGDPAQAEARSLIGDSRSLDGNISWAKAIIDSGTSLSANINYNRSDRRVLQGLNTVTLTNAAGDSALRTFGGDTPLEQRISTDTVATSGSLTKPVNAFRLTSTFDANLSETTQDVDRRFDTSALEADALAGLLAIDSALPNAFDAGFDTAATRIVSASTLTTLNGPVAQLPGGELLTTFDIGYDWTNLQTSDTRTLQDADLTRGELSTGVNVVVPITSRRTGFADALGSFTFNAQIGLNHLSDFGTLGDYTVGLNWAPFDNLDFSATYIEREVAPDLTALGNPEVVFLNTPVFDFTNGETVLATVTTGGNPDLLAETQRDWKFAMNWELPFWDGTRFTVEYISNRSNDVTAAFPQVTPDIEAAFPGRVTRDGAGTLLAVDRRFVTFAETRAKRLQFSLFLRGSIGAGEAGGRPGGGGGGGGGRPGGAPPSGPSSSDTPAPAASGSASGGAASDAASDAASGTASGTASGAGGAAAGAGGAPAAAGQRRGGPPSADQRAAFMEFRIRICADDGLDVLTRLVEAIENGEDLSEVIPGFDAQRFEAILSSVRDENGAVDPDRLAALREQICSFDPAGIGGPGQGAGGQRGTDGPGGPDGAIASVGGAPAGAPPGGPAGEGRPEGFAAFRAIACADDDGENLRALIARIDAGEDVSDALPGFDPQMAEMMLSRIRDENGNIPPERLASLRTQFCPAEGESAANGEGGPPSGGPQSGGGPPGGGFNPLAQRSFPGFRYFVTLNHTIELENEILIAPGLDPLDQLDGQATGAFGFPRHSSRIEGGIFGNGVGLRVSGRYTGETRLEGSGLPGSSDLFFGDLLTFDLRIFSEIGELVGKNEGILKNFRVSLRADNIFDGQRRVTDQSGATPINYQPFLIDPNGLYVGIDLRKLF